MHWRSIF